MYDVDQIICHWIYLHCLCTFSIFSFFYHRLKMLTQTLTKWYSLSEIPSRNVTGDTRVNPRPCSLNIYLFGVTEISEPWFLMLKFVCGLMYLPSDDLNVKQEYMYRTGITILCMIHVSGNFFFKMWLAM